MQICDNLGWMILAILPHRLKGVNLVSYLKIRSLGALGLTNLVEVQSTPLVVVSNQRICNGGRRSTLIPLPDLLSDDL